MVTHQRAATATAGKSGPFSPSLPSPRALCQHQYLTFALRLKLPGEDSTEGAGTSTTDRKKKTKGKPASVKSETL